MADGGTRAALNARIRLAKATREAQFRASARKERRAGEHPAEVEAAELQDAAIEGLLALARICGAPLSAESENHALSAVRAIRRLATNGRGP